MGPEHGAGSGDSATVKAAKDILFGGVSPMTSFVAIMERRVDKFKACRNGVKSIRTPLRPYQGPVTGAGVGRYSQVQRTFGLLV